jgi:YHS domain-containing protein
MIGSWKGTAVPSANRLKGWSETHLWAWKFSKGTPVGMTVELRGDKTLASGQLSYVADSKQYRLDGTDPAGKPVAFVGAVDKAGRALVLNRVGAAAGGKDRLTIRPNANLIRYTLDLDHQDPGAPQYSKVIAVGLTKEGESFAAGGSSADLPRCILTGGAATMTVSYQGKSYPICCSGCRDEFNENPEKYARKAALMSEPGGGKPAVRAATSNVGKDDGSFDGLVEEAKPKGKTMEKVAGSSAKASAASSKPEASSSARASGQLRLGQSLEKAGKTAGALKLYQQVVKDYPDTPSAKAAAARIKALGGG